MAYFKINGVDYSMYVNELKVNRVANYTAQTNAAGNSVVDYINAKREIEVGIIPVDATAMISLQNAINAFNVSISFLNPQTNTLEENVNCIIPTSNVEYYTI
jgi:hypothetical protein